MVLKGEGTRLNVRDESNCEGWVIGWRDQTVVFGFALEGISEAVVSFQSHVFLLTRPPADRPGNMETRKHGNMPSREVRAPRMTPACLRGTLARDCRWFPHDSAESLGCSGERSYRFINDRQRSLEFCLKRIVAVGEPCRRCIAGGLDGSMLAPAGKMMATSALRGYAGHARHPMVISRGHR